MRILAWCGIKSHGFDGSDTPFNWNSPQLAGAPIGMLINIYAGELPIRKMCNFDKPRNNILKGMDDCMHLFYLESIKSHIKRMIELQYSQFYMGPLVEP